jgi:hypothetical protein
MAPPLRAEIKGSNDFKVGCFYRLSQPGEAGGRFGGVMQSDADPIIPYDPRLPPEEIPMLIPNRDQKLGERLNRHSCLRMRVEGRFAVIQGAAGVDGGTRSWAILTHHYRNYFKYNQ